jgi:peptidoglycan/LPS O-acetylase OafA/YrhL
MILLGDSSYSLYLLHSLVLGAYFSPGPTSMRHHTWGGIAGGIALAIAIGIFVYLLIEQPARRALRPKTKPKPAIAEEAAKAW